MTPLEQWMIRTMEANPAPNLSLGEYAIGAIIMGIIVFVVVSFIGEGVMRVHRGAGRLIVVLSLPLGGLFAIGAFTIMVTG